MTDAMLSFLLYDAKVAALLAVFYLCYRLLLSRETLHRFNRIVLLTTAALSFVLPLCIITIHRTETVQIALEQTADSTASASVLPTILDSASNQPWWHVLLVVIYVLGASAVLCRVLLSLVSVLRIVRKAKITEENDDYRLIISDDDTPSFSWMQYIVLSKADHEQDVTAIMEHEKAHIRLHHSWDLLFVDFVSALQWFNPCVWMLRSDLRAIHEYEADEQVLRQGINLRQYQCLLISKAIAQSPFSLVNGFNHNDLRLRIRMMSVQKSSTSNCWRVVYVLPITFVALFASARTVVDYQYDSLPNLSNEASTPVHNPLQSGELQPALTTEEALGDVFPSTSPVKETTEASSTETEHAHPDTIKIATTAPIDAPVGKQGSVQPTIASPQDDNGIYEFCERSAAFKQGDAACRDYINRSIRYPESAMEHEASSRVFVRFVVETDGTLSHVQVIRNITVTNREDVTDAELEADKAALEQEAIRVTQSMSGLWEPGTIGGKRVRSWFNLPIFF